MVVQFDATIDDFVDVTIRSLKRQKMLRTWHWQGAALIALLSGGPAFALASGSTAVRLAIAFAATSLAVALYVWTSPETFKERIEKLCREELSRDWPVRIRVELDDSGIAISQAGSKTSYDWATIEGIEETDDAVYFYRRGNGCFAVRKRGFDSTEGKNQFVELVMLKIKLTPTTSELSANAQQTGS